jgi:hypothetical protein
VDTTALLLSLSQMALAIAGFSGITIAFIRTPGKLSDLERYRLAWLFGAFSPGPAVRIASGALVAFTVRSYSLLIGPTRRSLRETRLSSSFRFHAAYQFSRILFVRPAE